MNESKSFALNLKLTELNDMWRNYCMLHTELYDLTCDEYVHLLSSDMDQLEETLQVKNELIGRINLIETNRTKIITEINDIDETINVSKISDIVKLSASVGNDTETKQLEKYNALLLDIITKIQEQNKLNQLYLNKAIHSLKELKDSFSGRKTYQTYGANGVTRSRSVNP